MNIKKIKYNTGGYLTSEENLVIQQFKKVHLYKIDLQIKQELSIPTENIRILKSHDHIKTRGDKWIAFIYMYSYIFILNWEVKYFLFFQLPIKIVSTT